MRDEIVEVIETQVLCTALFFNYWQGRWLIGKTAMDKVQSLQGLQRALYRVYNKVISIA
jgi:hypothetical protein